MKQTLTQEQLLQQQQVQRLTQQQLLQVRLVEMPLTEFEEKVNTELADNPALDAMTQEEEWEANAGDEHFDGDASFEDTQEREAREDALEQALQGIGRDDEMPQTYHAGQQAEADYEEMVFGNTVSFYDSLREQMGELSLTEQQTQIMNYLIGSLDSDGLLRKDLDLLSDELAVHAYIDVSSSEIEQVLLMLQGFEPAGIGARSLQECLLLQVNRLLADTQQPGKKHTLTLLKTILLHHFTSFMKHRWDKIQQQLHLADAELADIRTAVHHLNPKPGASLGEAEGRSLQQITPDFLVETTDDGRVSFTLAHGEVPELKVSQTFLDMVDTYKTNQKNMNRQEKEALLYAKEKVDRAQGFIDAIHQRRRTLSLVMQAIIDWQLKFFQEGDEADLRPMILKDIAEKTQLDLSTVSRVCNQKYAQTRWGIFPLRFFFTERYTTNEGADISTRKIKIALRELIDHEDKHKPLPDDTLATEMKRLGYPIARRTVAKYREQMGIPTARLRKEQR